MSLIWPKKSLTRHVIKIEIVAKDCCERINFRQYKQQAKNNEPDALISPTSQLLKFLPFRLGHCHEERWITNDTVATEEATLATTVVTPSPSTTTRQGWREPLKRGRTTSEAGGSSTSWATSMPAVWPSPSSSLLKISSLSPYHHHSSAFSFFWLHFTPREPEFRHRATGTYYYEQKRQALCHPHCREGGKSSTTDD